ncbi:hypothetical protein IFM89_027539 [Coptis chinensis]|uniref:Uncharacterized protein n=1 Tax=Coptis chinensis TaxID=261450 RepID=A0A835LPA9_9MAGN|nr:hypothetical protein IFM89_027539 [Coptis chinensis]
MGQPTLFGVWENQVKRAPFQRIGKRSRNRERRRVRVEIGCGKEKAQRPRLSSCVELSSRLRSFLVACPPTGPSPPVVELVVAAADFQKDLASWNINPIKGGVDVKELQDVEKAIVEALEKQCSDVISPLKDNLAPKKFGFRYIQKLAKRTDCVYSVPEELGILLNSMKRILDVLRPRIETQLRSWGSCIPNGGSRYAEIQV